MAQKADVILFRFGQGSERHFELLEIYLDKIRSVQF